MDEFKLQIISVDLAKEFCKKMTELEATEIDTLLILARMTTILLLFLKNDEDEDGKELFTLFRNSLERTRSQYIKNLKNHGTYD